MVVTFYQSSSSSRGTSLCILDSSISLLFVSTLVVGYWRGCWQFMDIILFPNNTLLSIYSSLVIGIVLELLFCFGQFKLERIFKHHERPKLFFIGSRLYTVIFALACVNHWRGVWQIWDYYTGISWESGLISMGLGIFLLIVTRGINNILAPPFILLTDAPKDYFKMPTLFDAQRRKFRLRILDAFFTVVFTNSVVVFVWRGGWVLLDGFLFPDQVALSAVGSLIIGVALAIVAFLFQCLVPFCAAYSHKLLIKILLEDVYKIFVFVATVNVWRGVWVGLNVVFLPDDPLKSNLITAVCPQIILTLFYCANSLLVRGAVMDGSLPGEKGFIFAVSYFSYFLGDKKKKVGENFSKDFCNPDSKKSSGRSNSSSNFMKYNGGINVVPNDIEILRSDEDSTRFGDDSSAIKSDETTRCETDSDTDKNIEESTRFSEDSDVKRTRFGSISSSGQSTEETAL